MASYATVTRVRRIVTKARREAGGKSSAEFDAHALVAERLARIVDTAEEPARQLAALKELRATFGAMGLGGDDGRHGSPVGGGAGDDGGDPRERELAELMGAGPAAGDAADA